MIRKDFVIFCLSATATVAAAAACKPVSLAPKAASDGGSGDATSAGDVHLLFAPAAIQPPSVRPTLGLTEVESEISGMDFTLTSPTTSPGTGSTPASTGTDTSSTAIPDCLTRKSGTVHASKGVLWLSTTADVSDCLTTKDAQYKNATMRMVILMHCTGDLTAQDGKYFSDITNACQKDPSADIFYEMTITADLSGQNGGKPASAHAAFYAALATEDGKACVRTRQGSRGTFEPCTKLYSVAYTNPVNLSSDDLQKMGVWHHSAFGVLTGASGQRWYDSGTVRIDDADWQATLTYRQGAAPALRLVNGSTQVSASLGDTGTVLEDGAAPSASPDTGASGFASASASAGPDTSGGSYPSSGATATATPTSAYASASDQSVNLTDAVKLRSLLDVRRDAVLDSMRRIMPRLPRP